MLFGQPTSTAVSTGLSAVSSGQSVETHPLLAASQQGDCTPTSTVRGAGDANPAVSSGHQSAVSFSHQSAASSSHQSVVSSRHQSAVSSSHQSAVSSGHNNAAAPAFKQGDCPPADTGSSVRTKNHVAGFINHVPLTYRSCHRPTANSLVAVADIARL